ncbi:MAG: hypothetical protein KGQ37_04240 [Hyphomicrobiales bacterium]|nr:hypothetical protein [Hyphomicrobiales bacterium]
MIYDISHYSGWIAAAFLLGAVVGWLTFSGPHGKWLAGWFMWGAALFVVGLIAAIFHLLPGRFGLYLETALLLFGGYILGGHVGAWLKSLTADQSTGSAATASGPAASSTSLTGKVGAGAAAAASGPSGSGAAAVAGAGAATGAAAANAGNGVPAAGTKAAEGATTAAAATSGAVASGVAAVAGTAMGTTSAGAAGAAMSAAGTAAADAGKNVTAASAHGTLPGEQPPTLAAPLGGKADDLKLIKGIGPKNEAVLNGLGYHHFSQIAAWTAPQEEWIGHKMSFPGRIEREHWVAQAKSLAAGVETDHAKAVKAGLKVEDSAEDHAAAAATVAAGAAAGTVTFRHEKAAPSANPKLHYGPHHALVTPSDSHLPGTAPAMQLHADDGRGDDLTQIKGIGPANQAVLNGLGVHHFHQIAAWTPDNATWMGHKMAFPGRVEREEWVPQAQQLALARPAPAARAPDPAPSPALPDEGAHEGSRPPGFVTARGGRADDLKRIRGIGPQNEERLHGLGIWHFDQIAHWNHDQMRWVGSYLSFPGRIDREEWVSQAKALAAAAPGHAAKA